MFVSVCVVGYRTQAIVAVRLESAHSSNKTQLALGAPEPSHTLQHRFGTGQQGRKPQQT